MGIIFSIIAGLAMSLQGVFNTRTSEKIGLWHTSVIVQGIALIVALIALFFAKDGSFRAIKDVNKLYLLGGVLGAVITYTVMKGIDSLGATCAIGIILVAQITLAALIDAFGLFGTERLTFGINKIISVLMIIAGIILFKWK